MATTQHPSLVKTNRLSKDAESAPEACLASIFSRVIKHNHKLSILAKNNIMRINDLIVASWKYNSPNWVDVEVEVEDTAMRIRTILLGYVAVCNRTSSIYHDLRVLLNDLIRQKLTQNGCSDRDAKIRARDVFRGMTRDYDFIALVLPFLMLEDKDVAYKTIFNQILVEFSQRNLSKRSWYEDSMHVFSRFFNLVIVQNVTVYPEGFLEENFMPSSIKESVQTFSRSAENIDKLTVKFSALSEKLNSLIDMISDFFSSISTKFCNVFSVDITDYKSDNFLSDLFTKVASFIQKIHSIIEGGIANFTIAALGSFFSTLLSKLVSFFTTQTPIIIKLILVAFCYYFFVDSTEQSNTITAIFWAGICTVFLFMLFRHALPVTMETVLLQTMKVVHKFMSADVIEATVLVSMVLPMLFVKYDSKDIIGYLKLLRYIPMMSSGLITGASLLCILWNKVLTTLCTDPNSKLLDYQYEDKTDKMYNVCNPLLVDLQERLSHTDKFDEANISAISSIVSKLRVHTSKSMPRELSSYSVIINQAINRALVLLQEAKLAGRNPRGPRQEPVCVLVRGEPGVLKSTFALYVSSILHKLISGVEGTHEQLVKDTFVTNVHSEYWEGYTNQNIVVMDDFLQMRESVGDATSSSKIIEMINSMPTPLNMAHLESKGTTYFTSKAVILTSNIKKISSEALFSAEALSRRIHFYLDITLKPEYAKFENFHNSGGKADPLKMPKGKNGEYAVPGDIWNITWYSSTDKDGNPRNGKDITYHDLEQLLINSYYEKKKIFESTQYNLRKFRSFLSTPLNLRGINWDNVDIDLMASRTNTVKEIFSQLLGVDSSLSDGDFIYKCSDEYERRLPDNYDNAQTLSRNFFRVLSHFMTTQGDAEQLLQFATYCLDVNLFHRWDSKLIEEGGSLPIFDKVLEDLDFNLDLIPVGMKKGEQRWYSKFAPFLSYFKNNKLMTVGMIAGFTGLFLTWRFLVKNSQEEADLALILLDNDDSVVVLENGDVVKHGEKVFSIESSASGKQHPIKPKVAKVKTKVLSSTKVEGGLPLVYANKAQLEVVSKIEKNLCNIVLGTLDDGPLFILGNAMFVDREHILFNKHYASLVDMYLRTYRGEKNDLVLFFTKVCSIKDFEDDEDNSKFSEYIMGPAMPYTVFTHEMEMQGPITGKTDAVFMKLSDIFPGVKDITKFFMERAYYESLPDYFGVLLSAYNKERRVITNITATKVYDSMVDNYEPHMPRICIKDGLSYNYSLGPGSCGSPLYLISNSSSCIIGLHAAGGTQYNGDTVGKSIFISREDIISWRGDVEVTQVEGSSVMEFPFPSEPLQGKIPGAQLNTCIVPTGIRHCFGISTKAPAMLKCFKGPTGIINPMQLAYSRYGKGVFAPDGIAFSETRKKFIQNLVDSIGSFSAVPLCYRNAIDTIMLNGRSVPGITRSKSTGYPYCTTDVKKKKDIWGDEGVYTFDTPIAKQYEEIILSQVKTLKEGNRVEFVFMDCLKDETLPLKKVRIGKTRMFSACPVDYLVIFRMYFLNFTEQFIASRFLHSSMIGINPMGPEWDYLVRYLSTYSSVEAPNFLDGDFAGFDASQKKEIFLIILEAIEACFKNQDDYAEEHAVVRELLWRDVYSSVHVCGDSKVFWDGALPSGHPATSIINSLYNMFAFQYCWERCTEGFSRKYGRYPPFDQNIKLVVFGDDNLIGASNLAKKYFQPSLITQYMAELGLEYTSAKKDDLLHDYTSLFECTFLKRGFRREPVFGNQFVAPLSIESLIESMYWRKKTTHELDHIANVGELFLNEMAFHGDDIYNEYSTRFYQVLAEFGLFKQSKNNVSRRARLFHVYQSFTNLYEYTDAFQEDYIMMKQGERLRCEHDMLCLEGDKLGLHPPLNKIMATNLEYLEVKDLIKYKVEGDGDEVSSAVNETPNTVTIDTSDVASASTLGPTVKYISQNSHEITDYSNFCRPDTDLALGMVAGVNQDLQDFFAKPVIVATGSLANTDLPTTSFPIVFLPFDMQAITMWREKFKGFMSMKFDVVIKLQVNATRFQQGRYILYFVPYCGDSVASPTVGTLLSVSEPWFTMHTSNTCCVTQLPHVEIDLATQTEATLRVPYINTDPFTPIVQTALGFGTWGVASLFPYSPLVATAGSVDASYSIWLNLENVELYTPTVPQGDAESLEQKERGPVSRGLRLASKVSSVLGKIPLLSAVSGPTSYFLDVASDIARVFGWSRPLDVAKAERRFISQAPYACNFDAPVFGMPLTNSVNTSVGNMSGFAGNDLDEMSLISIVTRYAYYARYTWSTANIYGDNILHLGLAPALMYRDIVVTNPSLTYRQHTPASYVANLFRFWRGSMKIRVKLVKTEFHSGRIMFTWVPFDYRAVPPVTNVLSSPMIQFATKNIYDISSCTQFEIIIPYASNTPWGEGPNAIGYLDAFILDPLKAPNTVSSSITLLVEFAMCPDAQFNDYHSEQLRTPYCHPIRVEGASITEGVVDSGFIGGKGSMANSDDAAQYCMGDTVLSLRNLLKRPHYIQYTDSVRTGLSGTYSQANGFQTFCAPYRATFAAVTVVATVNTMMFPSTGANDLYGNLACIFALSRGSMCAEIHIPPGTTSNANPGMIVYKIGNSVLSGAVSNSAQRAAGPAGITGGISYVGTNGVRNASAPLASYTIANPLHHQVKADCYNRSYARPNASLLGIDNTLLTIPPTQRTATSYAPDVIIGASTSNSVLYYWSRFAGDDFSMGYFVSIPPMLINLSDIATDGSY